MENSQGTTYSSSSSYGLCDIFQIEYVNSYILLNGYHNALPFIVTWLDCADKHSSYNLT